MAGFQDLPVEVVIFIVHALLMKDVTAPFEDAGPQTHPRPAAYRSPTGTGFPARPFESDVVNCRALSCELSLRGWWEHIERTRPRHSVSSLAPAETQQRRGPVAPSAYRVAAGCLKLRQVCRWLNRVVIDNPLLRAYVTGDFSALSGDLPSLREYLVLDAICPCDIPHALGCSGDAARYTAVPRPFRYECLPAHLRSLEIREDSRVIHLGSDLLHLNVSEFPNLETAKLRNSLMLPCGPALRALDYRAPAHCDVSFKHLRSVVKRSNGLRELRLAVSSILEADRLYFQIQRRSKSRVGMPSLLYLSLSADLPSTRAFVCSFRFPPRAEVHHEIRVSDRRYPLTAVDFARLAGTMRWPERASDVFSATLSRYDAFPSQQLARQMAQPPHDLALYAAVRLHIESGLVCLTFAENVAAALATPDAFDREPSSRPARYPRRTIGTRIDFRTSRDPVADAELHIPPSSSDLRWLCSLMRDVYGPRCDHELTLVLCVDASSPVTPSGWAELLMPFDACQTLVIPEVCPPFGQSAPHRAFDRLVSLARYLGNGAQDPHEHEHEAPLSFVNECIRLVLVSRDHLGDEPEAKLLLLDALSLRVGWYPPSSDVKWALR